MIRTAEEFGVKVATFQHNLEGYKVADEIAKHGAGSSIFSDWWAYKFEVYDAIPYAGPLLRERGVLVSFNSDSDELARRLNTEAAKAVKYGGLAPADALAFVTSNPARQLGIFDRTGSLEAGKDADFVVWSEDPLSSSTVALETWIEGKKYFDRAADLARRPALEKERAELVAKAKKILERGGEAGGRQVRRSPAARGHPGARGTRKKGDAAGRSSRARRRLRRPGGSREAASPRRDRVERSSRPVRRDDRARRRHGPPGQRARRRERHGRDHRREDRRGRRRRRRSGGRESRRRFGQARLSDPPAGRDEPGARRDQRGARDRRLGGDRRRQPGGARRRRDELRLRAPARHAIGRRSRRGRDADRRDRVRLGRGDEARRLDARGCGAAGSRVRHRHLARPHDRPLAAGAFLRPDPGEAPGRGGGEAEGRLRRGARVRQGARGGGEGRRSAPRLRPAAGGAPGRSRREDPGARGRGPARADPRGARVGEGRAT